MAIEESLLKVTQALFTFNNAENGPEVHPEPRL
jgi:hypothetical protein